MTTEMNTNQLLARSKPLLVQGLKLKQRGFHVVPIAEGTKAPVGVIGWEKSNFGDDQLTQFAERIGRMQYTGCGILLGLPTVNGKSIYAFDVDCADPVVAGKLFDRLETVFGTSYLHRIGAVPKFCIPFLMDKTGLRKQKTADYFKDDNRAIKCMVEVLGLGQQVVCYATHPDTGRPYQWYNGDLAEVDVNFLPVLNQTQLKDALKLCTDVFEEEGYQARNVAIVGNQINRKARPPLAAFNIDDASALMPILHKHHPDLVEEYDSWLKIGMALHHQFGGSAEAFALFDDWSSLCKGKYDPEACEHKWRTFKDELAGGYTIRSVLILPGVREWWVARTFKFGNILEENRHTLSLLEDNELLADELTARYAFIADADKFYDTKDKVYLSKKTLNELWDRPPIVDPTSGRTTRRLLSTQVFFNSPKGIIANGLSWHPTMEKVIKYDGRTFVNTFEPWSIQAVAGDLTPWLAICSHVWGTYTDLVLDWMAFSLQYPETKVKWQILVYGSPRTGKTLAAAPWLRMFGAAGSEVGQEMLEAGWGDSYMRKKAIVFEEVWFPGGKAFFNSLKSKLVNDHIEAINVKGRPVEYQQNLYSIYMCSNHEDALAFNADDDKLLVIKGPDERLPEEFYARLAQQIENTATPLMEAIFEHLMTRDVSQFSYGSLPIRTEAAIEMAEYNKAGWEDFIEDLHGSATPPFDKKVVMFEDVRNVLAEANYKFTPTRLKVIMEKLGYKKYRGQKEVEKSKKYTPRFYTTENLKRASHTEIYDFYQENLDKKKFQE